MQTINGWHVETEMAGFAKQLTTLRNHLQPVYDLRAAAAILNWDQTTYMPPKGNSARSQQFATLERLAHEKFIDPHIGNLLDQLGPAVTDLPVHNDVASLIRVTRRAYEEAIRVPVAFTEELAHHSSLSYAAWAEARTTNNFSLVVPYLEKTLILSRRLSDFFPGYQHIADPLINLNDYGMSVALLRPLFSELKQALLVLVQQISVQSQVDDSFLYRHYPEDKQWALGRAVIEEFGYDFRRGRLDKTHHPFMTKFAHDDIRITTRIQENQLAEGLFSMMHEAGHALYEMGVQAHFDSTPLGEGTSSGVHESQSRLWENLVGRSLGMWEHCYPNLQKVFPDQLKNITMFDFYRGINKVAPSLIRTDADEVTYNLHVIIRFELELALLEGTLAINDLPEAWHAAYQETLGVVAPDDSDGVLQDVHWFAGTIGGAFQGYTLGNILASQFYAAAIEAHPSIPDDIRKGQFTTLHDWLRSNIYQHGSKFTTTELVQRVTGEPLTLKPYLAYLQTKYQGIYSFQ